MTSIILIECADIEIILIPSAELISKLLLLILNFVLSHTYNKILIKCICSQWHSSFRVFSTLYSRKGCSYCTSSSLSQSILLSAWSCPGLRRYQIERRSWWPLGKIQPKASFKFECHAGLKNASRLLKAVLIPILNWPWHILWSKLQENWLSNAVIWMENLRLGRYYHWLF